MSSMKIINRKASFHYKILEKYEGGIVLGGGEVKSLKVGGADISNSYAKIVNGEVYLINANIPIEGKRDYNSTRSRKILLHKSEIVSINTKIKAKKLTLIPLKMYNKGRLIKIELALAKPKREFEKRQAIKKKDLEREIERELRGEKKIN
ncbi:SsrA-binding protein [Candidatus Woesebacteria bacterium RIFCSPLOWO2_01_FULL_39_61]|uniref:SsrA-binding protein n=1 Tax=Candidatus Woesebacteria bacterium RIFCSPHIGHO2_02_FULL_39_13 TaxID=1802505 RepID=A0A1F7Z4G3_9BACT|nr:MAG: SsrA-binding protein [Candidatus Woesebacteria bacterium RIFCSPHIGHO2_01_FULL_39_95]OGM34522.1 MAG: SsrA-binding protein [Candidatus Woesebacteria bacterium RIFCSPHIGHO2_02_FULL_39_13]OGM38789.1 MAG: SsrA-binding protein [Candidatus Woesebacteria bacterium RIFCSPHIGHO2_12_FULL_40_20]OGM65795.1 MAG: SsrA-binding protein [Candidatus Woesebacteria bacterium RIFCSPLOWO2_01_FULL_39_61]OGM73868.1 MAG: SsrA-binding protein [Candidatus Woesebacteria bacterium RIFCSPLOWO2_12_FULL_39_9]